MQIPVNPQDLLSLGLAALIRTAIVFFFCRSLIKTLSYIQPENRRINKLSIWLLLIPGLSFIFNFIVVFGMTSSLKNELESRDFEGDDRPAFFTGIVFAILSLVDLLPSLITIPPNFLVLLAVIAFSQIYFFVQYWMKINWYRNVLKSDEEGTLKDENDEE